MSDLKKALQDKKFKLRNNVRRMSSVLRHQRMSKKNRMALRATIQKLEQEIDDLNHMLKFA
jgi:polyhydroxyalkanoate synthesis regulator phasin